MRPKYDQWLDHEETEPLSLEDSRALELLRKA
jgi:hypothetical protein